MLTNTEIIRAGKRVMRVERRFKRTVINTDHMVKFLVQLNLLSIIQIISISAMK